MRSVVDQDFGETSAAIRSSRHGACAHGETTTGKDLACVLYTSGLSRPWKPFCRYL
jgi:hypothetical protein